MTYATSYKFARNKLNKLKKKAKTTYFRSKFNYYVNNSKKTWNLINTIISKQPKSLVESFIIDSNLVTDKNVIANCFNCFLIILLMLVYS